MTLTSTYDHRIIQGAESGDFLRTIHELLLGEDGSGTSVFAALRIPYEPIRWTTDIAVSHDEEVGKPARVIELIHAYRVRGHLMADTNPLEFELRRHPDLDVVHARPDAVGPRPRVPHRRLRRAAADEAARDPRRAARLLLPHGRHRVHAHPGPRAARAGSRTGSSGHTKPGPRGAAADPRQAQPGRGVRDLPADQVRRAEAVLARRRRVGDPAARRSRVGGRTRRHGRGRHRHGPPRPAQRPRQHRRQVVRPDLLGVRGQPRPAYGARLRRREVPPRRRGHLHRARRRDRQGHAHLEPVPPGDRRPGRRGHRPREAGHHQPRRRRLHRAADPDPRRRGVRRPGRRRRDAEPLAAARLPHRRHGPRRDQQPGRLHDVAGQRPVERLLAPTSPG